MLGSLIHGPLDGTINLILFSPIERMLNSPINIMLDGLICEILYR